MRSLARRSVLVFVSTAACVLGCVTPRPSP